MPRFLEKKQKVAAFILCMAVVLWVTLIFVLSFQAAEESNTLSRNVTAFVIKAVDRVWPLNLEDKPVQVWIWELDEVVRKYAHGAMFFILSVLMSGVLRKIGVKMLKSILITLILCAVYAYISEMLQIRIAGRSFETDDLLADCAGILLGLVLSILVNMLNTIGKALSSRRRFQP